MSVEGPERFTGGCPCYERVAFDRSAGLLRRRAIPGN